MSGTCFQKPFSITTSYETENNRKRKLAWSSETQFPLFTLWCVVLHVYGNNCTGPCSFIRDHHVASGDEYCSQDNATIKTEHVQKRFPTLL